MDIANVLTIIISILTLMVSFGMLIAFIMSNSHKK